MGLFPNLWFEYRIQSAHDMPPSLPATTFATGFTNRMAAGTLQFTANFNQRLAAADRADAVSTGAAGGVG